MTQFKSIKMTIVFALSIITVGSFGYNELRFHPCSPYYARIMRIM
jgi:hypothetical protein